MRRVLCVWLPRWPLQQWFHSQGLHKPPAVRAGQVPAALYESAPRGALQIAYCSAAAQALGIRAGMPVAEATVLAGRDAHGPSLQLAPYDPSAAHTALVALAAWCEHFSPLVGLEEAPRPASLLLDVTGLAPLFRGEEPLVAQLVQGLRAQGWHARVALADTIGTAWALAHFAAHAGRAGLIVPPGESASALAPLPLAALRIADEQTALLADLGLIEIGQLADLPRAGLATRCGPELLRRWDQALGALSETIRSARQSPTFQAAWSCEQPLERADVIEAVAEHLLEQVCAALREQQRGAVQLTCRLLGLGSSSLTTKNAQPTPQRSGAVELSLGLLRPSAAPRYLLDLLRLQLDRVRLRQAVSAVELEVTTTEPLATRQRELFAGFTERDHSQHWATLVDQLSSRLGRACVLRARLSRDAQPEQACRYEPLVDGKRPEWPSSRALDDRSTRNSSTRGRSTRSRGKRPAQREEAAPLRDERSFKWSQRPLNLAPRPIPLTVTAVVPDGPLLWFMLAGQQRRVAQSWGPERIETGWWRGPSVRRDYYRVETVDGHRHWLFRRLNDGQWFWHGAFD